MSHQLNQFPANPEQDFVGINAQEEIGLLNSEVSMLAMNIDTYGLANGADKDILPDGNSNDISSPETNAKQDGDKQLQNNLNIEADVDVQENDINGTALESNLGENMMDK